MLYLLSPFVSPNLDYGEDIGYAHLIEIYETFHSYLRLGERDLRENQNIVGRDSISYLRSYWEGVLGPEEAYLSSRCLCICPDL